MNKTKEQWEDYCIKHIRENGNRYSAFWATENKFVANAMDRLRPRLKTRIEGFPFTYVEKIMSSMNLKDS